MSTTPECRGTARPGGGSCAITWPAGTVADDSLCNFADTPAALRLARASLSVSPITLGTILTGASDGGSMLTGAADELRKTTGKTAWCGPHRVAKSPTHRTRTNTPAAAAAMI